VVLLVQFDAKFHFLQNGTTTTLYDALTPLPWPYFVFHVGYGANYFWSQLFNTGLTSTCASASGSASTRTRTITCASTSTGTSASADISTSSVVTEAWVQHVVADLAIRIVCQCCIGGVRE
jgi:hypothetical protein